MSRLTKLQTFNIRNLPELPSSVPYFATGILRRNLARDVVDLMLSGMGSDQPTPRLKTFAIGATTFQDTKIGIYQLTNNEL